MIGESHKNDGFDNDNSIRCNILRSVSNLIMIHSINRGYFTNHNTFLFNTTNVDKNLIECAKDVNYFVFQCTSVDKHPKLRSRHPQNAPNQQTLSTGRVSDEEVYICQACMIWCHREHGKRKGIKLGAPPVSSFPGFIRMLVFDGVRRCSIVGEKKCKCNHIMDCEFKKVEMVC